MLRRVYCATPSAWSGACRNAICNPYRITCMKDFTIVLNGFSSRYINLFSPDIKFRWKSSNASENSSLSEVKENTSSQLTLGQKGMQKNI